MSDSQLRKKGRPTKSVQLNIQDKVQECYLRGLSAAATSQITGHDIKTVTKYFNEFYEQGRVARKKDFLERQDEERQREIACYDFLMAEEFDYYDTIKDEIAKARKKSEPVPEYLLKKHSESVRMITMLNEKRGAVAMSPPLDEDLKKMVKEMIGDVKK